MFRRDSKGVEVSRKEFKWQAHEGWIERTGADQRCEGGSRKVVGVGICMTFVCPTQDINWNEDNPLTPSTS